MRLVLVVAILAASAPTLAAPDRLAHANVICHKTAEKVGGLKKTCYYDCGAWEGGLIENVYDHCASWTVRWRLNHNSQFGPRSRPRARS
jgi:hypothetical protein